MCAAIATGCRHDRVATHRCRDAERVPDADAPIALASRDDPDARRHGTERIGGPDVATVGRENQHLRRGKRLEGSAHFDDLANILFDQAVLAEGGHLEDPAAYVRRVNGLLTA